MKTLYVSDLDGTLLRSDETISEYTAQTINRLTTEGMLFSYATARSYHTAKKVTKGLEAKIPLIVYNGAFILDNVTGEVMCSNFFGEEAKVILDDFIGNGLYPIVYSYIDCVEKFSFIPDKCSRAQTEFLESRRGDIRTNVVLETEQLYAGDIFYFTCIDEKERLEPLYERYKDSCHCVFQKDIYSGEQWLEIMPLAASKSNAIRQLKNYLGCEKVVVFGDAINDLDMFQMADECYAVANAAPELKEIATQVIGGNNEDGVVKWLEQNFNAREESK